MHYAADEIKQQGQGGICVVNDALAANVREGVKKTWVFNGLQDFYDVC